MKRGWSWRTGIRTDPLYGLLTLICVVAIYWLSSRPELGTADANQVVDVGSNLAHLPMFGALAFCLARTISQGRLISWRVTVLVALIAGGFAALDEWHQSFVAGRFCSATDFLLDVTGVVGALAILRFRTHPEDSQ
jgi:VanZ family protein